MDSVLLVIHLLACTALVGAVLLQRSEGGALGMGGGGGGGLISGRGAASVLVRTTMVLGAAFFVTSLVLARIHSAESDPNSTLGREIEQRGEEVFDPLSPTTGAAPPASTGAAQATPPASVPADPLAPVLSAPPAAAPATQAPASAPPATDAGSATPATPAPSGGQPPAQPQE